MDKDKDLINKINKLFSLTFTDEVDKTVLRNKVVEENKNINKLNRLVHPLVKKEIIAFINASKTSLIFVEVPLLFEAKFENLFDYIIASDVSKEVQNKRLLERNPLSKNQLEKIYNNNYFNEYKKMVDIIIINDKTINHLYKELDKVINILKSRLN
jgi:dephospho-CoA kinase